MRSFAAASTIPVTNKVAQTNIRKSFTMLVMMPPLRSIGDRGRRRAADNRHDGDTSNLGAKRTTIGLVPDKQGNILVPVPYSKWL
jgi:hypothetical protein